MKKRINSNGKPVRILAGLFLVLVLVGGNNVLGQTAGYPYKSFTEFRNDLNRICVLSDRAESDKQINSLWDLLKKDHQIPFRMGDSVAFLYRGEAKTVSWAGDFSKWQPAQPGYVGIRPGQANIWIAVQKFPADARLDYKIVVDEKWMTDPDNSYIQMSGMGPNSELRMPGWKFPEMTELLPDVIRGDLSDNYLLKSDKLGYQVDYKVYMPYNYASSESLPVIYVTDGPDFTEDAKGAMLIVLDNLIFSGEIKPVIAVFIDPREPGNEKNNRRMQEYACNQKYADFVGDELVPLIDKTYKTHACPDDRAIMGISLGGLVSAWFGAVRTQDFHLLGMQSPAFNKAVLDRFAKLDWFPFKVYLSTGVINDTQQQALEMKQILEKNKVDFVYKEVNEGHSWGNWKALLPDMLRYFFPGPQADR